MKIRTEWNVDDDNLSDRFYDKETELQNVIDNFNFRRLYSNEGHEITINNVTEKCLVQTSSNPLRELDDQRKIHCPISMTINRGDYVEYDNMTWLIMTNVVNVDGAYKSARMSLCTYHLYWQNANGVIIDRWGMVENASSYSSGETGNSTITLSANQFLVNMKLDDETVDLENVRLFIDHYKNKKPTPYRLTRPDNVGMSVNGVGYTSYIFTLDQRNDETDKQVTLEDGTIAWIANYIAPTAPSNPENGNETVDLFAHITYAGSNNIRIGGNGKTFTASLTDANDAEKTMTAIWTITPNDYVITSQDGNSLLVKCDDEDLDGETITISVKDNYSGFTTSVEITLSVF